MSLFYLRTCAPVKGNPWNIAWLYPCHGALFILKGMCLCLCVPPLPSASWRCALVSFKLFERDCLRVVCWHLQIRSDPVLAIPDCFHIDNWIVPHVPCVFSIIPAEPTTNMVKVFVQWSCSSWNFGDLVGLWRLHVYTKQYPRMSTRVFVFHCLPVIGMQNFCSSIDHKAWKHFCTLLSMCDFGGARLRNHMVKLNGGLSDPKKAVPPLKQGTSRTHASRCLLQGRYCPVTCYVLLLLGSVTSSYRQILMKMFVVWTTKLAWTSRICDPFFTFVAVVQA